MIEAEAAANPLQPAGVKESGFCACCLCHDDGKSGCVSGLALGDVLCETSSFAGRCHRADHGSGPWC